MDINTLEAFLALADHLNFTRAAEHLYISQPAFSRQITRLEDEFGSPLFVRDKRKVELTEFGKTFYLYAQSIHTEYNKWLLELKQMNSLKSGNVRIGILQDLPHELIPDLVKGFRDNYGNIEMILSDRNMTDIINGILHREIDVAFTLSSEITNTESISSLALDRLRLCVAMCDSHPLANKEVISIKDLENEPFVMIVHSEYGPGARHIHYLCKREGFEPNISCYTHFVPSLLMFIKCGLGISIVVEKARNLLPDGVKLIPLDDSIARVALLLIWKNKITNPAVPSFIESCKNIAKTEELDISEEFNT